MINNFLNIIKVINKFFKLIFILLLFQFTAYSQPISNLDQFYTLIDSASNSLLNNLGNTKKVNLELNFGVDYSIFANQVRGKLLKNGIQLIGDNSADDNYSRVNFVVDNCLVSYSDPEKNGIFGDFFTIRTVELSGNYFISDNPQLNEFKFAARDTVQVEEIEKVENRSYPFTQGDLPPEPFFSSLLEPIVAIGAAAVTIFLFFSVRSK